MGNNLLQTFETILERFGAVTVMDICVYKLKEEYKYSHDIPLNAGHFVYTGICLDTLKISSIKQESPKKVFNIGINNMPLIQTGKSFVINIEDALGRSQALKNFLSAQKLNITNNIDILYFNQNIKTMPLLLEGRTTILLDNNTKKDIYILIPCFIPDSVFNLILDESNSAVFDLSGKAYPALLQETPFVNKTSFIDIREESFFVNNGMFLEYQKNTAIFTTYTVLGRGAETRDDIAIPLYYNNIPVRGIADEAFINDTTIKSLSFSEDQNGSLLPPGLWSIGERAFYGCTNLSGTIVLPSTINTMYGYAFANCTKINQVYARSFVGSFDFMDCTGITKIVVLHAVGEGAFIRCTNLQTVYIGINTKNIASNAFAETNIVDVYYEGNEDEWNQISIGEGNDSLTGAIIHFNSVMPSSI